MVESAPKIVVFTNHGTALGIAKQTTITTSSTAKTNLRIVRGSEYIQRFRNIGIKHKLGVSHIVPDAFSRLQHEFSTEDYTEGELDALCASSFAYTVSTHVQMKASMKKKLLDGYKADPAWTKITLVLENNNNAGEDAAKLLFWRDNEGLIWKVEDSTAEAAYTPARLSIPDNCTKEFLSIAHSDGHIGRDKCYELITRHWFVYKLDCKLRDF